jgi:hypothetical protein
MCDRPAANGLVGALPRPWIPEPGMWLQFDWGEGPRIGARRTGLFCAWLAWSRFRVVIPVWDQMIGARLRVGPERLALNEAGSAAALRYGDRVDQRRWQGQLR